MSKASFPGGSISASEFKARCLELMDRVAERGVSLLITKHGKTVAKLSPPTEDAPDLFASERIEFIGDIMQPVDVVWEADE